MGLFNRSKIRKEQEKERYFLMLMNNYEANKQKIPAGAKTYQISDTVRNTFIVYLDNDKLCFIKQPDHEMAETEQWLNETTTNFEKYSVETCFDLYAKHSQLNLGDYLEINLSDIQSFSGHDEHSTTVSTTGGGGGGFSLLRAAGGYAVGGSLGAVIGGLKKIEPITTTTNNYHWVYTKLVYFDRLLDKDWGEHFAPDAYDIFMDIIPEKEYNYVMSQKVPKKAESGKSTKEKLIELKELLDDGLITKEEYETKRNEILNSI